MAKYFGQHAHDPIDSFLSFAARASAGGSAKEPEHLRHSGSVVVLVKRENTLQSFDEKRQKSEFYHEAVDDVSSIGKLLKQIKNIFDVQGICPLNQPTRENYSEHFQVYTAMSRNSPCVKPSKRSQDEANVLPEGAILPGLTQL
jgi:hypothetical protein